MNFRLIIFIKKWGFLLLLVVLFGCTTNRVILDEQSNEWISRPLSELKQAMDRPDSYASKIAWKESTYPLSNGYYVFIEPLSPACSIRWKINPRDIIVDFSADGSGCEQKRIDNVSDLHRITPPQAVGW